LSFLPAPRSNFNIQKTILGCSQSLGLDNEGSEAVTTGFCPSGKVSSHLRLFLTCPLSSLESEGK